jgi:hypothetical protein
VRVERGCVNPQCCQHLSREKSSCSQRLGLVCVPRLGGGESETKVRVRIWVLVGSEHGQSSHHGSSLLLRPCNRYWWFTKPFLSGQFTQHQLLVEAAKAHSCSMEENISWGAGQVWGYNRLAPLLQCRASLAQVMFQNPWKWGCSCLLLRSHPV